MHRHRRPLLFVWILLLAGCAPVRQGAPVVDRTPSAAPQAKTVPAPSRADSRGEVYVVKRGDTLYSIALEHGMDYRELAAINGITDPGTLPVGRELKLKRPAPPAALAPAASEPGGVVTAPLVVPSGIEAKPLGDSVTLKTEPKGYKLPYSAEALARMKSGTPLAAAKPESATPPKPEAKPDPKPEARPGPDPEGDGEIDWAWPVTGKLISRFSEGSKGIDIAGRMGQPVYASAPGKVVYTGSGLRGYGKLVIIKHNSAYLSAYAHNREILVKEGQSVAKGQQIAEMGNTDADQVKLHFEIRRYGKPVDPLKYLPADRAS
ncbi:peptidoglycan DD-metalloendopeptidase family protein [Pelomicrobium sp. G1]|uniref:peptidoglycan DD-metalloendopeptidase family protein n=1 Tax=unclassified Pelomicrobium TaxID=2815318 RepID=UPI0021DD09D0|nr:MAG: peptidoglycan-binding protein LysM [Burkholderiales bacterium]